MPNGIRDILNAVKNLHANRIVRRDIRQENITKLVNDV